MTRFLLSTRIIFCPNPDELVQMVSAQDRRISCQVVEVVHDDGDEQVEHEKGAEENEGDEVGVGEHRTAGLERVDDLPGRLIVLERSWVADAAGLAGQHDTRPSLAGSTSNNL